MTQYENYGTSILDIKFYLIDEDGNAIENKDGTTKEFRIKDGVRFKPLEYLCEDFDTDILEEIKEKRMSITWNTGRAAERARYNLKLNKKKAARGPELQAPSGKLQAP